MALARVLGVRPGEIVRPRDDDARALACETDERFGQRQILVHRQDVVRDDAVSFRDDRSKLAHEAVDQRVVCLRSLPLRE